MNLKETFDKYNCDKGSMRHRYDRVYEPTLQKLKNRPIRILEIGILRGESIEAMLDFLPNAEIVGIDIFGRVPSTDVPVLKEERVLWADCNSIKGPNDKFKSLVGAGFDVIIDDGQHTPEAQRKTFENFFPFLKVNGMYFIEDVWPFDRMDWMEKQHPWLKNNPMSWNDKEYEKLLETISPYNVTFHDIRKGYEPDTFIIEIRNIL